MLFKTGFPQWAWAGMTMRDSDFKLSADAEGLTATQATALKNNYGVEARSVFTIRQVHDNQILHVRQNDLPQHGPLPNADGVITADPGVTLTVRTADCIPVFLCDPVKRCIGLVHAGWRGTAEKIVVAAIGAMEQQFGTHSHDLCVAIGPSIRACCYEVGEEFRDIFPQEISKHKQKGSLHLDLVLANMHQLMTYGVKASQIFDSHLCTGCDQQFYSYRREKERSGRHMSFLQIRP